MIDVVAYIILGSLYAGYEWKKRRERNPQPSVLVKTVEKAEKIRNVLDFIKSRYKCSRVSITQYHNGGKFYTGASMQKMTMTFDVYDYHLRSIRREYENRILSDEDHDLIRKLLRFGIERIDYVNKMPDCEMKYLATSNNIRSIYIFLLRDSKHQPIGALNIHFTISEGLNSNDITEIKGKIVQIQNLI